MRKERIAVERDLFFSFLLSFLLFLVIKNDNFFVENKIEENILIITGKLECCYLNVLWTFIDDKGNFKFVILYFD
ncbi:hypothetical protein [Enterococcus dispar]|uniref:hypothetical protein n=1 Tax=Enterococcus dispar TaxID=44009 RepID=UPI002891379A|nr:hypothetical protein [Enterococcus dispar]MDT2705848.1 hypothetical protein [Enterococcus dispar]